MTGASRAAGQTAPKMIINPQISHLRLNTSIPPNMQGIPNNVAVAICEFRNTVATTCYKNR